MVVVDWIIVVVVVLSALISLKRGFVKELLSLATWVAALVIAVIFSERLAGLMVGLIATESWRLAAAFALLFILTLIVGAMVNHLIGELVRMTGLSGLDRTLGIVFGLLRGVIIVIALLAIARLFALDGTWQGSVLVPWLEPLVNWAGGHVHSASERVFDIRR
ncbi:MAG: CvpA family protein [Natronospirillum sp.]|uniref:CvpA family protein n=1 Tax=Natronospirillum sp. TaxID=2812955 RepID=UPI0025EAFCF8|nr:CvpA family protein [Natronospirillum sp.]MCH8551363.1 CvpA family protein [Natronospirillum sp.]